MDNVCTGFQLVEWIFPVINSCCAVHDLGGTDGSLLDCLQSVLPNWTWAPAGAAIALMIALRPVYNLGQKRGWWK